MPLVTVVQLQEQLGWRDIREEALTDYPMRWFRAVPQDESQPSIDFLFDDDIEFLEQIGSGDWHCHPNEIEEAIELARKLIHHELCILQEYDTNGRCSGGGPVAPGALLDTLHLDASFFMRRFFGLPAVREEIEFSRYFKGRHVYVELQNKAEIDAFWESQDQPPPEF